MDCLHFDNILTLSATSCVPSRCWRGGAAGRLGGAPAALPPGPALRCAGWPGHPGCSRAKAGSLCRTRRAPPRCQVKSGQQVRRGWPDSLVRVLALTFQAMAHQLRLGTAILAAGAVALAVLGVLVLAPQRVSRGAGRWAVATSPRARRRHCHVVCRLEAGAAAAAPLGGRRGRQRGRHHTGVHVQRPCYTPLLLAVSAGGCVRDQSSGNRGRRQRRQLHGGSGVHAPPRMGDCLGAGRAAQPGRVAQHALPANGTGVYTA